MNYPYKKGTMMIFCNHDCQNCTPVDLEEYMKMSNEQKDLETERALCRIRKKVNAIVYGGLYA